MAKQEFDNTNRISLFVNDSDNEKAPKLKGTIDIEGQKYNVSVWKTETDKLECGYFLSGKIEEYEASQKKASQKKGKKQTNDLPF